MSLRPFLPTCGSCSISSHVYFKEQNFLGFMYLAFVSTPVRCFGNEATPYPLFFLAGGDEQGHPGDTVMYGVCV